MSERSHLLLAAIVLIASLTAIILGLTFGLSKRPLANDSVEEPHFPQPDIDDRERFESAFGQYRYAAVASDTTICSQVGIDILARLGGSAVDSAIATMLCVGVVNCHSNGIGGGHFMTIYERPNDCPQCPKEMNSILARERAPGAADRDMFVNTTDQSTNGGLAIAVPGEIGGFYEAWKRYGRVSWSELIIPSIRLCRDGFPVPRDLAGAIQVYTETITNDANLAEIFMRDGELLKEGDILYNDKLANTLAIIADQPLAFYQSNSTLAQDIVADIAEYDGIITLDDLMLYNASVKEPLHVHLENGNYSVYGPRPPSSGAVLQYILNILDGYNFSPADIDSAEANILAYHRILEAYKFAYAKRSSLGDEDYVDIQELLVNLTSDDYASYTRSRISDERTFNTSYYEPDFEDFVDHGTAHASVLSADGAAVAITSTINLFFGSNVRGSRTGIIFNNEMDDFSTPGMDNAFGLPPSPSNFIEPGKVPMSSMCPIVVVDGDGQVRFVSGASGGTRITTATAYVLMHSLWFNDRVDNATDRPRIHHQLVPTPMTYEADLPEALLGGLAEKGHEQSRVTNIGVVQSIHNTCSFNQGGDCVHAVSDGRKGGAPDGY